MTNIVPSQGYNDWEIPKQMQLQEWLLDAQLYSVDLTFARSAFRALKRCMHALLTHADACWVRRWTIWLCALPASVKKPETTV